MSAVDFQIAFVAGKPPSVNGRVQAPVVLVVAGDQKLVEGVRLDSPTSKSRTAKRWAERFGLDAAAVEAEFDRLCRVAVAKFTERKQKREKAAQEAEPVSAVADRFITELGPEWHKVGKSLYLAKVGREVPIGQLWSHLDDTWISAITQTREAVEADCTTYRGAIALFRDAVAIAAAKTIGGLPEHADVRDDATVDSEELRRELVAWLIRPRTFRADNGNAVNVSYHMWAAAISADSPWQQCFADPVFAGFHDDQRAIAIKGEWLTQELRRESGKKLASDLRKAGLADTDATVKVTGKVYRVWRVSPAVLGSIAQEVTP